MNLDQSNIDILYTALRAYRIITDPDGGFYKKASCSNEDNFSDLYRGLAALFEPRILKLYNVISSIVGVANLGVADIVLEPVSLDGSKFRDEVQEKEIFLNIFQELRQMNNNSAETVLDAISSCFEDTVKNSNTLLNQNGKPTYLSVGQLDQKIEKFLKLWTKSSDSYSLNVEDFLIIPSVGDKVDISIVRNIKLEENIVLATLEEIIKLIPANPYNEFIKGNYFIGHLLCHSITAIQITSSISIQKLVKFGPKYRLR
jgi:hypothetical protein